MADLITEGDAVWYETTHSSGHVHKTGITMKNDDICHIDAKVIVDGACTIKGYNNFNNGVSSAGGPFQYSSLTQLSSASNPGDTNRLYVGLQNEYGPGCKIALGDPKTFTQSTGGSMLVYIHETDGTHADPIKIEPTHFDIPNAYEYLGYTGVELAVGDMIFLTWVHSVWRVLNTTGTYVV